jgi:hypothetical protein
MKKYTFKEFIGALESEDFDVIDDWPKRFSDHYIASIPEVLSNEYHNGDCTNISSPCPYCVLEWYLNEYKEYSFNEEQWREDNGKNIIR